MSSISFRLHWVQRSVFDSLILLRYLFRWTFSSLSFVIKTSIVLLFVLYQGQSPRVGFSRPKFELCFSVSHNWFHFCTLCFLVSVFRLFNSIGYVISCSCLPRLAW